MREELKGRRDNKRVWCNLRLVGGSFEPVSRLKPNNANFSLQIYAKAWLTLLHQWPYWVWCRLNQKKTSQTEALMLLGPMHHWKGGKKGGNWQGLKLLCYQRSIAPLCGKDNCPRASLNRHTSMSGIANSTQPVAMTARGYDKERQTSLKCKMLRRCGTHESPWPSPELQGTKPCIQTEGKAP